MGPVWIRPPQWLRLLLIGAILLGIVHATETERNAAHGGATENHALAVIPRKPYPRTSPKPYPSTTMKKLPSTKAGNTSSPAKPNAGYSNVTSPPINGTNTTVNATTLSPANVSSANNSLNQKIEVHKIHNVHSFWSSLFTWREDSYALSVLIPITCGVSAAVLIICTLWCIACCKRRCRSRYRRKAFRQLDPKTIRKMKASDRIKLLAASSDEEF
ncbi:uncharacterized protein LOC135397209 [Ornithodoros turicata]|uniref:uncharacterized protein LOC135397209 n=1 Tax=Ornithodoros turicata TaxID=34597 RepID=UPI00313996BE